MVNFIDMSKLPVTSDGCSYKLPILYIGVTALQKAYPQFFGLKQCGTYQFCTYPVSEPYQELSGYYVDVSIKEKDLALTILNYCGDPSRLGFAFIDT